MLQRQLGRSGIEISALGLGCWAIGGPFWHDGHPAGWSYVDDTESLRALHRALDLGITFFDTSDVYGCGHSERVLGQALAGHRDHVVIATKFGHTFEEHTRQMTGDNASPAYIRRACEASLRRLNTEYIDLYQFHLGDYDPVLAVQVRAVLEELIGEGKIRFYGWSTDDPERARVFAQGTHCVAVQHRLNLFSTYPAAMLALCEEYDLASINRTPLAMGVLTGKYRLGVTFPPDDVRHDYDREEAAVMFAQLDALRDILTRDGRTLAQGALGWIWGCSPRTIPIPGFKTAAQVEENVSTLPLGPLSREQMQEINALFGR